MASAALFPDEAATRIPMLLREVIDARAYQRLLCVKLGLAGQSAEEVATTLGWHPNSVRRVWTRYRREGEAALLGRPYGGRHHAYLTVAQEEALLAPFLGQAEVGGVLVAGPIQVAYEDRVGTPVARSTVYRLLERHGWRKVAPRRRHPQQDDAVAEQFKRTSPRRCWTRSAAKQPIPPAGRSG